MKSTLNYKFRYLILPGLKRWILTIIVGILGIVIGVLLLLGYHPITLSGIFLRELMEHAADVLPHRISGIIVIVVGVLAVCLAVARVTISVLGAYLPEDREAIADALFKKRHLDRGVKIVVIGGGTGLSNLLTGLKTYTNNLTAIVTVGDDGGSSGRLREEFGVMPPGDIRHCITALADEQKIVTELFNYRFQSGEGLSGHSFGNLFLSALCAINHGDMIEATKVASRVLNSCGQVLPSSLTPMTLIAQLEDGREIRGESQITKINGQIQKLTCEPKYPKAVPEAIKAILQAELIIIGPGSLYTSIMPNLLVTDIVNALYQAKAPKLFVCNVANQAGETSGYKASDYIEAILKHVSSDIKLENLFKAVLVNESPDNFAFNDKIDLVDVEPQYFKDCNIELIKRNLINEKNPTHHSPSKLARAIMLWFMRWQKNHLNMVNKSKPEQILSKA